jgi:phosphatidylserine decarboxylase
MTSFEIENTIKLLFLYSFEIIVFILSIYALLIYTIDLKCVNNKKNIIIILNCILIFIFLFLLYFHRIPKVNIQQKTTIKNDLILSPAFGKVRFIKKINNCIQISIFLNVDDIHIQYCPFPGIIKNIRKKNGSYNHANSIHADNNSQTKITLKTKYGDMIIKQISGVLARKITVFNKINECINYGDKLGFIRFGSRVDLFIPTTNKNVLIYIKKGDYLNGSNTVIGKFN